MVFLSPVGTRRVLLLIFIFIFFFYPIFFILEARTALQVERNLSKQVWSFQEFVSGINIWTEDNKMKANTAHLGWKEKKTKWAILSLLSHSWPQTDIKVKIFDENWMRNDSTDL